MRGPADNGRVGIVFSPILVAGMTLDGICELHEGHKGIVVALQDVLECSVAGLRDQCFQKGLDFVSVRRELSQNENHDVESNFVNRRWPVTYVQLLARTRTNTVVRSSLLDH